MSFLNQKVILVTGGTGSFGRAFTKHVLKHFRPKKLIIYSRDEMKQHEMRKDFQNSCLRFFVGDVRDSNRLHQAFNGVDLVVHTAALKIVPTAEYNPFEVVKTNVIGSENVINAAINQKVDKVIALSTDKAANPINLYGATKLCAEKMLIASNNYSPYGTKFAVVRYGNVFGSRGSVVPIFLECRKTGVVPITDERMTRFWITLDQGVRFVLRSLEEMTGGEIYVPKLPSLRVVDLAKAVCGNGRLKFKVIGIRPGEKIHETLVTENERVYATESKDRFVLRPPVIFQKKKLPKKISVGEIPSAYTSDKNDLWLSVHEMKRMVEKEL